MGNFQLPKTTVFDVNGDPVSGAKLNFYVTGTSTRLATYPTEADMLAATNAHANPVVADSAGRVAPIYLLEDEAYKVVTTDADDVIIYSVDPVKGYALSDSGGGGGGGSGGGSQIAWTPLDYPSAIIVGDGVANEAAAVQWAVDNTTGTVDLAGKTFRCDSTITLRSGIRLLNGTLDFSNCTSATCLTAAGVYGTLISLSSNAPIGSTTLTISSTTGLAVGGWLRLASATLWYTSTIDAGEMVQIKSVDSGTQVTLTSKVLSSYSGGVDFVVPITFVKDITLEDLRLIGLHTATDQSGLKLEFCENFIARSVKASGFNTFGFDIRTTVQSSLRDCYVRNIRSATGTGIDVNRGSRHFTISDCRVDMAATGIAVGGLTSISGDMALCRDVQINNCNVHGTTVRGVFVGASQGVSVRNTTVLCGSGATSDGIYVEGSDATIIGNTIRHPSRYGALLQPKQTIVYTTVTNPTTKSDECGVTFSNNLIEFSVSDAIRLVTDTSGQALAGLHIMNNAINGSGACGIDVLISDQNATNLRIEGNTLSACTEQPISVVVAAAKTLRRVSICNNTLEGHGATKDGIQLFGTDASSVAIANVSGNIISGGQHGMLLRNCSQITVSRNVINAPGADGINYDLTVAGTYKDIQINANTITSPTSQGVYFNAGTGITARDTHIADNIVSSPTGEGIYVTTATATVLSRLAITGNTLGAVNSSEECIYVTSVDAAGITQLRVTDNTCTGGARGIHLANCSQALVKGNNIQIHGTNGLYGVYCSACPQLNIDGNIIDGNGDVNAAGIYAENANDIRVSNNILRECCLYGIELLNSSSAVHRSWSVVGNDFHAISATTYAVYVHTTLDGFVANVNISSNNIELDGAGSGIYIKSINANPGQITSLLISSNNIHIPIHKGIVYDNAGTNAATGIAILSNYIKAVGRPIDIIGDTLRLVIMGNSIIDGDYAVAQFGTTDVLSCVAANYLSGQSAGSFSGSFHFDATSSTDTDLPNLTV